MGDTLYVGSCSGKFLALDRATGELAWSYDASVDAANAQFHGDALVAADVVIAGSDSAAQAYLYAFERETGEVRWKRGFSGGVAVTPLRHDKNVYVMTGAGDVVSVKLDSGEIDWSFSGGSLNGGGQSRSNPVLVGVRLLVAWPSGRLAAFDRATGELLWKTDLGSAVNTSLAGVDTAVVAGTIDGRLHRLDAASGEILTQLDLGGVLYGDLVVAEGCIYVLSGETEAKSTAGERHRIRCIEPALTETVWSHHFSQEWSTFHPLLFADVVVAGHTGQLVAFDRQAGAERWTCAIDGTPRGLASSRDTLYVGTLRGPVLAISIADCTGGES